METGGETGGEIPGALLKVERLRAYFRAGRAPWIKDGGRLGFITTGKLQSDLDLQVSAAEFSHRLRTLLRVELAEQATQEFARRTPTECARFASLPVSRASAVFAALATFILIVCAPALAVAAFTIAASTLFLLISVVRLSLAALARDGGEPPARVALHDEALPVVTILAPLFREAHALPGLIASLDRLDYPTAKLDIKMLLEDGDAETIEEALKLPLDDRFDLIVVPASRPQTKPKACNYGLACARGDLLVIYDAEDEPEPDQLREAAGIFAAAGDDLACVQARLNFYNVDDNWLTRLFTLEYCLWFDHFLPALDRIGAPVPLGGTSNIFRTEILAEVGGWDPYNVTEDADLGLRLARRGYRTAVMRSTTLEEANCRLGNWMRQRSRWMKGFMQTWLVHAANRSDGWRTVLSADFFIGGTVLAALINPLLWFALAAEKSGLYSPFNGLPVLVANFNSIALIVSTLSLIGLAALAPLRRGLGALSPAALLIPVYWIMMSVAAWRAFVQLFSRPDYWEKTDHGLSAGAGERRLAALSAFGLEEGAGSGQISRDGSTPVRRSRPRKENSTQ